MENLNKNWLKDKVDDYTIKELEGIKSEIINCSNTNKNVFNGAPFYESEVMRVQQEDRIKRINKEKNIIPEFNETEKQKFINKYIELIKNRPDLDVSN